MYLVAQHRFRHPQTAFARGERPIKNEATPAPRPRPAVLPGEGWLRRYCLWRPIRSRTSKDTSTPRSATIAPRRSPVRVRLAPSGEPQQLLGFLLSAVELRSSLRELPCHPAEREVTITPAGASPRSSRTDHSSTERWSATYSSTSTTRPARSSGRSSTDHTRTTTARRRSSTTAKTAHPSGLPTRCQTELATRSAQLMEQGTSAIKETLESMTAARKAEAVA